MTHGRVAEAETHRRSGRVERAARCATRCRTAHVRLRPTRAAYALRRSRPASSTYPRARLGFVLMTAQAFFYNAIFFTYALVLGASSRSRRRGGVYLLPFADRQFPWPPRCWAACSTPGSPADDAATYAMSGCCWRSRPPCSRGHADALTRRSPGRSYSSSLRPPASSAYLTVSESFRRVRALAIAVFYAVGTAIGGIGAPWLFGR